MSFLLKVYRAFFSAFRILPKDESVAIIRNNLICELRDKPQKQQNPTYCVAVQCPHDPLFYALFAGLITDLRDRISIDGRLLLLNSINYAIGTGWQQSIARSVPYSYLISSQWARANREIVGPVGYRSISLSNPIDDLFDWLRAGKIWKLLQACSDPSKFIIDDVLIGDLVIDTYIRFRPCPEFKVLDPFVKKIIWQLLRDLRKAHSFFSRVKPKLYLTSYSTYVNHGIAVRVALSCGVPVRSYGNLFVFGMKLSSDHFFHTPNTYNYRAEFFTLTNQEDCLSAAEHQLKLRLSGNIDTATSYMKKSAYAPSTESVPDVDGDVVIFLHDFYDSPHVYADLIFPDFWSWITFTIDVLKQANIKFWIKPHPNQIGLSDLAYEELLNRYPDLRIISPKITNVQLAEAGMKCGVTMYGTVAHELAYLGVPSIGSAKHPHHSFDFCRTADSRESYKSLLLTPDVCNLSKKDMRDQALRFYYMHNLYGSVDDLKLRSEYAKFFKTAGDVNANASSLSDGLMTLRSLPAWKKHIDQLALEIAQ